VYWYNKSTGKSTWEPPPGSIYASSTPKAEFELRSVDDGLPPRPTNEDPVSDSEGTVVPYLFSKPAAGGNWQVMRKEEAVEEGSNTAQRILVCAFDVDAVGLVVVFKGKDAG
jgi:hypothetical protein